MLRSPPLQKDAAQGFEVWKFPPPSHATADPREGQRWAKFFSGPFPPPLSQSQIGTSRLAQLAEILGKIGEILNKFAAPGDSGEMQSAAGSDTQLQNVIQLATAGDESARQALLDHASERLMRLTRKMFHTYPALRRWEQTDDVFQNAMLRLHRALADVQPESVRHFFNLAAVQIRRELLDLAKHHFGPQGAGANHHTDGQPADDEGGSIHGHADEPENVQDWTEFHGQVEGLPDEEQEVVNLLWYEGLTQQEAATVLGVSLRTVKRRWHSARLKLFEALSDD